MIIKKKTGASKSKRPTKRTATSKPSKQSEKNGRGNVSVEKGRRFEDDVANLYRLLGAEVIQGIEICQKKVDILATFLYPVRHRVIVECKNEKKAVDANQRVMQFQGLLEVARRAGEADSAEIITNVSWGDAAKGFAHRAGINLLTYTEKLAKLIDFTSYLKGLVNKFDNGDSSRPSEPPLAAYYIDLSAEHTIKGKPERIPVIDTYVYEWL